MSLSCSSSILACFGSLWVFDTSSHPAPFDNSLRSAPEPTLLTALLIHVLSDNCTLGTAPQPCAQDQGCVLSQPSFSPAFPLLPCWFFCYFHHKLPVTCSSLKWIWQPRGTSQLYWKKCFLAKCWFPQHFSPFTKTYLSYGTKVLYNWYAKKRIK